MFRVKINKINFKIRKFDKKTTRTKGPTDRPPARRSVGSRWLLRKLHTLGTVHWDSAVLPPTTPQLASTSTMTYAEEPSVVATEAAIALDFFSYINPHRCSTYHLMTSSRLDITNASCFTEHGFIQPLVGVFSKFQRF